MKLFHDGKLICEILDPLYFVFAGVTVALCVASVYPVLCGIAAIVQAACQSRHE